MSLNNTITASRQFGLLSCPRANFFTYEIGLQETTDAHLALRVGSAWARAMEARWNGASYDEALALAIPEGIRLDLFSCATVAGLLAAYYDIYGHVEEFGKILPEAQFDFAIEGTAFRAMGKLDGIGELADGRHVIVESKTTGMDIGPFSEYWTRLRFNIQLLQYFDAAEVYGWNISEVLYDVTRKPTIRPKKDIVELDENGLKVVVDSKGNRVFKKKKVEVVQQKKFSIKFRKVLGVKIPKEKKPHPVFEEVDDLDKPLQSASKKLGHKVKSHSETPDEFRDRVYNDAMTRPEFYFCRREVSILIDDIERFRKQRLSLIGLIEYYRSREVNFGTEDFESNRDQDAWPRNVCEHNCKFCRFKTFCLQNITVDPACPPEGFAVKGFNVELEPTPQEQEQEQTTE